MSKLSYAIQNAMSWITMYRYFEYSKCLRKYKFFTRKDATSYMKSNNYSKPVNVYQCKLCGGYHIGTSFESGSPIVWFGNDKFIMDSRHTDQQSAQLRGRELQISKVRYRIRSYNKPVALQGVYYVYKELNGGVINND